MPSRRGTVRPPRSALRVVMAEDTADTSRKKAMAAAVKEHQQQLEVDEDSEIRRLYNRTNARYDGAYPASRQPETTTTNAFGTTTVDPVVLDGVGWLGFCELIGWMYPGTLWTETQLHQTFVGAGILPVRFM